MSDRLRQPRVTVRLDNIAANYRTVQAQVGERRAGAVVKANAYGLGAVPVAKRLAAEGCDTFFVARLGEGIALREALAAEGFAQAVIFVFDGVGGGDAPELIGHRLLPVVNSLAQLERWRAAAAEYGRALPVALHFDTGMRRLGLGADEQELFLASPERWLDGLSLKATISHLASADVNTPAAHAQSAEQLAWFRRIVESLPQTANSLANSAGVFLSPAFHFDVVRPGICLYGGHPLPEVDQPNPMLPGAVVEAPIVQVRNASPGETVGYGATHTLGQPSRIATVPVGYADGFVRSASSSATVALGEFRAPIVGRVSMDLITIDVTGLPESVAGEGCPVELIGPHRPIDEVASLAGTIPHEFYTRLGNRFAWRYLP